MVIWDSLLLLVGPVTQLVRCFCVNFSIKIMTKVHFWPLTSKVVIWVLQICLAIKQALPFRSVRVPLLSAQVYNSNANQASMALLTRQHKRISFCLDPLLKSDFTDFYAQNAFCKKSEMFGWDFAKCKMHFANSHFQSRSQNPKYFLF